MSLGRMLAWLEADAARRYGAAALWALCLLICAVTPAAAIDATAVPADQDRIEITAFGEVFEGRGDTLQVETAAGLDGIPGRMSVRASTPGTNPSWIVFALRNPGDKPIERWITAERYSAVGSGVIWPDLDARRVEAVTPSLGFLPERIKSDRADLFRITLDPGQTITYVAELASNRFARIYLWKPLEYEVKARDRQLLNGILLGISGLLAIFLTAVFAANHKAIFPSAALLTWCVMACLTVDFGFFHKLFQLLPENNAIYRAATESAMAASFVVFLYTFLRIGSWHGFIRMLAGVWIVGQVALVAIAIIDPRLAATFARLSFLLIGGLGGMVILFLALRGQDRALALIPTWLLLLVWVFAAGVLLTGRLSGDIAVSGLVAGLVLLVVLIGFTVTQFAFRSLDPHYGAAPEELQARSDAIESAGAVTWEWTARRDEIKVSPVLEAMLGFNPGELSCKVPDFLKHVHNADRERLRLLLTSTQERGGGVLQLDFRMRHADNSYRWLELDASSTPGGDRRSLRCAGLIRDITDQRRSQERLLHDAVHDSLTGTPNRALFIDRLKTAVKRAAAETQVHPTLIFIDIDKFKSVNSSFGLIVGDSLLLTVARRLSRHVGDFDTLARVGGDQFALLLLSQQDPRELAMLAERIRRSLRAPIKIAGQDIVLTASIGIAAYGVGGTTPEDLLRDAEIAMYRAKRTGADRIEIFSPEMRADRDERVAIESDLRAALEKKQLKVLYQPIIYVPTEELAGFEALVRWEHPTQGLLNPAEFIPVAEESDLIVKLGSYVLNAAAAQVARWHKELPREENALFVSVNVSSRQLLRPDLIQEIRHFLGRNLVPPGALRLEVTESLVMENPEKAIEMLELLRNAGALLSLDDFGTGYSSLAYLQRFPFDTIKIDRELVRGGSAEGGGSPIVRSIVALAQELGRKVVAEGVEHAEDVSFLRSVGAEYAQGYYYGEPMPEREVMSMLRVIRKSERKLQRRGYFRTKVKSAAPPTPSPAPASANQRRAAEAGEGKTAKTGTPPTKTKANGAAPPNGASEAGVATPQAIAASLKAAETGRGRPAVPRIGNELPPGAVRVRSRNPQAEQSPPPAAPGPARPPLPSAGSANVLAAAPPQPAQPPAPYPVQPAAAAPAGQPMPQATQGYAAPPQPLPASALIPPVPPTPLRPQAHAEVHPYPHMMPAAQPPVPSQAYDARVAPPPVQAAHPALTPGREAHLVAMIGQADTAPAPVAAAAPAPPQQPAGPVVRAPLEKTVTKPNLEGLPPAIAASIARLAGITDDKPAPTGQPASPLSSLTKKSAGT